MGELRFPPCFINKIFGLLWQVEQVTAKGMFSIFDLTLTLYPEATLGPLAFPVRAIGAIGTWKVQAMFPFCWAAWTGPKSWTVQAVTAYGTISEF